MSRSKYKSSYYRYNFLAILKKYKNKRKFKNNRETTIYDKNCKIIPKYENLFIKVYNGKDVVTLKIHKKMIGYKFGEFIYTRKKFIYKKK